MKLANIKDFKMGWFIGDFEPTLLKTPAFEIAHHSYKKDFAAEPHTHKVATEYNYIVSGKLTTWGQTLGPGDIFIYEPLDVTDVIFLEDTELIIIKTPSLPGDKYPVGDSCASPL